MRSLESSVPHRLGRRTNFIPALEGKPAKWADVIDSVSDAQKRASLAKSVVATTLIRDPDGRPTVTTADVDVVAQLTPDQLFAVRRPASHRGMRNYISRATVPSQAHESRAVWCESFNELSHLRDLLITSRPTQVSTQPLRLEWVFASGVRSHVPDFLLRVAGGKTMLVDVTTRSKLDDPRLRSILQLTRATAETIGWEYEVRTELPPQRVRNLNFVYAGRQDIRQDRSSAARLLRQARGPIDVERASQLLGGGPHGYLRLWDLIAHGLAHIPLDEPIDIDSRVLSDRPAGGGSWLVNL